MSRFIDPFFTNTFVDSNILNGIASGADPEMEEILQRCDEHGMMLHLPYSVKAELDHPRTPAAVRAAASRFIFSIEVPLTEPEIRRYRDAVSTAVGAAFVKNVERDMFHAFEAAKYGGYFITRDKRLLARGRELSGALRIEVVVPADFLLALSRAEERRRALRST
jgi:hypothetical protein